MQPGPATGADPEGGKAGDHDVSGSSRAAAWRSGRSTLTRARIVWKTIVGAPWPVQPVAGRRGGLSLIGRDGREVVLDAERISRAGSWSRRFPGRASFRCRRAGGCGSRLRGKTIEAIVPQGRLESALGARSGEAGDWQKIALPAALAAEPIAWGDGVLLPGRDARAYLIDPLTGRASAEPFVPKFDRDHQGSWLPPAAVDRETVVLADNVGHIHRVATKTAPVPRLVGEATATLPQRDRGRAGLDGRRGDRRDGRPPRASAGRPVT